MTLFPMLRRVGANSSNVVRWNLPLRNVVPHQTRTPTSRRVLQRTRYLAVSSEYFTLCFPFAGTIENIYPRHE